VDRYRYGTETSNSTSQGKADVCITKEPVGS
jgi:hypothetical protein